LTGILGIASNSLMRKRLPTFLTEQETDAILGATWRERDRVMMLVMRYMGLRVSEVVKLRIEHIDFRARILNVRDAKGGKDRVLPIPKDILGPLRGWAGNRPDGFMFPSPRGGQLSVRAVQLLLKKLAIKAKLRAATEPRRVTPHKLRHAFCSGKIAKGVDIAVVRDLMGHSSIAVTDVYAHTTPERLREAMEL
jgi:integrase/recombinase XerD